MMSYVSLFLFLLAVGAGQDLQLHVSQTGLAIILLVELIAVICLIYIIFKKSKTRFEQACRTAQEETPKRTVKSERFNVSSSPKFYIVATVPLLTAILLLFAGTWFMYDFSNMSKTNFIYLIFTVAAIPLFIYTSIEHYMFMRRCFLIIDKIGIRGVYVKESLSLLPKYEGINVRWEQVASAKLIKDTLGDVSTEHLVLYGDKDCRNSEADILLMYFPTSGVTAQINRFIPVIEEING